MPRTLIPEPGTVFRAVADQESELRRQYLRIDPSRPVDGLSREHAEILVKSSALLLELVTASVCFYEALDGADPRQFFSREQLDSLAEKARLLSGLDLREVVPQATEAFPALAEHSAQSSEDRPTIAAIMRASRSLLEACPIDELELLAFQLSIEVWGHRCRVAYEGLHAFLLRNDERELARLGLLGREYASGVLSVADAAVLLGLREPDAVVLLEAQGFRRPIDTIRLRDEDRAGIFSAMRKDRLERQGKPEFSKQHVIRDVLASERIEGVDARPWIPRDMI